MRKRYRRLDLAGMEVRIDHGGDKPEEFIEIDIPATDRTVYKTAHATREKIRDTFISYSQRPPK